MRKTTVKMVDITELYRAYIDWKDEDPDNELSVISYTDEDENEVVVAGGESLIFYIMEKYDSYFLYDGIGARMAVRSEQEYDAEIAFNDFRFFWDHFCSMHPEYIRMAQMLARTDYDPLENYDRKEDGGWKDTTDDDATHSMSYAEQKTTTENDPKIKTKTTGSTYPDNSSPAVPETESITEPVRASATDKDTITTTNDAHIDTSYVEGDLTVTRLFQDYRVHGNIGVTTAAQMIAGEGEVRSKYVLEPLIYDAFAKEHFTLVKEVRV